MLAYGMKLYFTDGSWCYLCVESTIDCPVGTLNEAQIKPFMTLSEVEDYYFKIKHSICSWQGRRVQLDGSRCSAIRINY